MVQRKSTLWCLVALLGLAMPAYGGEFKLEGTWKLTTVSAATATESPVALIQVAKVGGQLKGAVLDSRPQSAEVKSVTLKGDTLQVVLLVGKQENTFAGSITKNVKVVKGSYGTDALLSPATMTPVLDDKINPEMTVKLDVPPMKKAAELNAKVQEILGKYY